MERFLFTVLGGRLRVVLIVSFAVVAAITVGLNALVSSRVITSYLEGAMAERVARDMNLAHAFYQLKQDEITAIGHRLVLDPLVTPNLPLASRGNAEARRIIDQQIANKITVLALGGTHIIGVLNAQGDLIVGRVLSPAGEQTPVSDAGNWLGLPIVATVFATQQSQAGTEVIPVEFLSYVGLEEQAHIELLPTERAAPEPYDPREGSAGLAIVGVSPIMSRDGELIGAVFAAYMFNNDFTLVDRIKEVAGIDTVTLFFGDLRISTNVRDERGNRAVGTRISREVYDVVLIGNRDYVGRAYVVTDWYISRYAPLHDHQGNVTGIIYVGALESKFLELVRTFNSRAVLIALVCIALAGIIAVPIAHVITRPVAELVEANRRLAQGDITVRVHPYGKGELAVLGESFNTMAETLHKTQQELLHKEKLASMGQLAAGVAHEINNPLGTILLFAEAMHNDAPEDSRQRDDLRMIIKETTRCKNIVADLLNFARQQEVLAQETDIHALLERAVEAVSHQPIFERVQFVRQFAPALPKIQADPDQLHQVMINLLNNAADAMEGQGTITLATRTVDRDWVEIRVTDTGRGIPEENLGKLFTPFFTTKPPGKGTGLGLSIVYGIIKMHRGQITVQSKVGEGTTFTITLPLQLPLDSVGNKSNAGVIG